jgi:hypothetical protein
MQGTPDKRVTKKANTLVEEEGDEDEDEGEDEDEEVRSGAVSTGLRLRLLLVTQRRGNLWRFAKRHGSFSRCPVDWRLK